MRTLTNIIIHGIHATIITRTVFIDTRLMPVIKVWLLPKCYETSFKVKSSNKVAVIQAVCDIDLGALFHPAHKSAHITIMFYVRRQIGRHTHMVNVQICTFISTLTHKSSIIKTALYFTCYSQVSNSRTGSNSMEQTKFIIAIKVNG